MSGRVGWWLGLVVSLAGCGDDGGVGGGGGAGGQAAEPEVVELFPEAEPLPGESECKVTITTGLPNQGQTHREICTELGYETNPPSSGDHWPIWARFGKHTTPVRRELLVHDLEHGAVLLLHRDLDAPEVIAALDAAAASLEPDPICTGESASATGKRLIVSPDPELDTPIGLSAWGATYVATCIDPPSLEAFVRDHYGRGPEAVCAEGVDPLTDERLIACL